MLTGKITSLHISDQAIKILEASINRGRIEIKNAVTMPNANRFFNSSGRLINLVAMVDAVVMTMVSGGMTAKRLAIAFEGSAIETAYSIDPISTVKKRGLANLNLRLGSGGGRNTGADPTRIDYDLSATINSRHVWGQYITRDEQGEAVSITQADRDLIDSLSREFGKHGYKVISVESPDTAMIYTRNTIDYSYDSLCKLVLHAENTERGTLYVMTKDVPSAIKPINFDALEGYSLQDRVRSLCLNEMNSGQMRTPYIYLIGEAFANINLYIQIAKDLEEDGLQVVDLYGMNKDVEQIPDAVQICVGDDADPTMPELSSEFGVCMCLLLRCYEDKPENLCSGRLPSLVTPKVLVHGGKVLRLAALCFLLVNILLTGLTAYEAASVRKEIQDSSSLKTQLNQMQAKRDDARLQLEILNTIDPRLVDVFTFLYENVDASVNIASVDTIDMIPTAESSSSQFADGTASDGTSGAAASSGAEQGSTDSNASSGSSGSQASHTQQLIIRGYSVRSGGSIDLYNALQRAGIGEVQLVGHQQVELPSGETIYIFELSAGVKGVY